MAPRIAGTVHAAVNLVWLLADIFHNVDFTASGPTGWANVVAKHPKRRPHSLPLRNLNAGFKASIFLVEQTLRLQPGRGVLTSDTILAGVGLLVGGDDQVAILYVCVLRSIGVA